MTTTTEQETTMSALKDAAERYAYTASIAHEARTARDAAIRAAADAGHPRTEIAKAARVSREMVYRVLGASVAVLAVLLLGACGGAEPAAAPTVTVTVDEQGEVVQPAAVETPTAGAPEDCWQITQAIRDEYNAFLPGAELNAWLEALPDPSEGCGPNDESALKSFDEILSNQPPVS